MRDEEILAVRRVRHEISAECGHDVHKVAAYYRTFEEQSRRAGKAHSKSVAKRTRPKGRKTSRN